MEETRGIRDVARRAGFGALVGPRRGGAALLPEGSPEDLHLAQAGRSPCQQLEGPPRCQHVFGRSPDVEGSLLEDLARAPFQVVQADQAVVAEEALHLRRGLGASRLQRVQPSSQRRVTAVAEMEPNDDRPELPGGIGSDRWRPSHDAFDRLSQQAGGIGDVDEAPRALPRRASLRTDGYPRALQVLSVAPPANSTMPGLEKSWIDPPNRMLISMSPTTSCTENGSRLVSDGTTRRAASRHRKRS